MWHRRLERWRPQLAFFIVGEPRGALFDRSPAGRLVSTQGQADAWPDCARRSCPCCLCSGVYRRTSREAVVPEESGLTPGWPDRVGCDWLFHSDFPILQAPPIDPRFQDFALRRLGAPSGHISRVCARLV
eukprot:ctg_1427.g458